MTKIYTIGVYGETELRFFEKLTFNQIDLFVDIRRRRAVRGSKYAFVNSTKLQKKLSELEIKYQHILELAPTNDIRELQKKDDLRKGINKSDRQELGDVFKREYTEKILNKYDLGQLFKIAEDLKTSRLVLFCVESIPKACHRSIVTDRINRDFDIDIQHL